MPLAFSISEGIAVGILAHTFLRALSGSARGKVGVTLWILSAVFALRYLIQ